MARVCESKLLVGFNLDGHALCPLWGFCEERYSKDELCQCEILDSYTADGIRSYLESLTYPHPTLEEVIGNE